MSELLQTAAGLPDIPRWMYARGLLLSGECRLLGTRPRGPGCVVIGTRWLLTCSIGEPEKSDIREAAAAARADEEFVAAPESAARIGRMLPHWRREMAGLHTLPHDQKLDKLESDSAGQVRLLEDEDYERLGHVPGKLRGQLLLARRHRAAAAFLDGKAVSFCYAPLRTETLWDIAVDTLPDYRRRGLATHCVRFMILRMRSRGLSPVWGAAESNAPSRRMAGALGFQAVDKIAVFSRER